MAKTMAAYRRCHICGATSEAHADVRECGSCGKPFAPFYYFKPEHAPVQLDQGLRPPDLEGSYRPIQGLTAYWHLD